MSEATSLGAAIAAGTAVGVWNKQASDNIRQFVGVFSEPNSINDKSEKLKGRLYDSAPVGVC